MPFEAQTITYNYIIWDLPIHMFLFHKQEQRCQKFYLGTQDSKKDKMS